MFCHFKTVTKITKFIKRLQYKEQNLALLRHYYHVTHMQTTSAKIIVSECQKHWEARTKDNRDLYACPALP